MKNKVRIDPMEFPLKEGESWYIVHPNNRNAEFCVPAGGITVCTTDFYNFSQNTVYSIVGDDSHNGWIQVESINEIVEMPYYVFARYFDAEAFVRGTFSVDPDKAKPFDYKPTLPYRKQLELFKD